jgi:hypothetical protein
MEMIHGREMIQWSKLNLISTKVEQQEVPGVGETEDARQDDSIQRTGVAVVVALQVVFDGSEGEFDGAGGEFDGAAGAIGLGRLIVALPASFKLSAAASIAFAALLSEFWGFWTRISEFAATRGGLDFTDRM